MGRRLAGWGALALAGALFACSPFGSATSEPSPAVDAGRVDAPVEAGIAEAASPSGCPDRHFCDGFERAEPVGTGWSIGPPNDRVSLSVDGTIASTETHSLYALAKPGGASAARQLTHPLGGAKRVRLKFSLRRASTTSASELQIVHVVGATNADVLYVAMNGTTIGLAEVAEGAHHPGDETSDVPQAGVWVAYELIVDFENKTAVLEANGTRAASMMIEKAHPAPYQLRVGLFALPSTADASVWIDDIDLVTE